nr:inactive rhomboid protein 1 [Hymenolepis microstoma]
MEDLDEISKRISSQSERSKATTHNSLKEKAVGLLVNGFINTNEDWNSRRLRYNLKKYGKIKVDKLGKSCDDFTPRDTVPDPPHRESLRRQVSLMTQLGTPAPFSPVGIAAYRNNALRTLSNLVIDTTVRRRHKNAKSSNAALDLQRMSVCESAVWKLPAGKIVSSPVGNESFGCNSVCRDSTTIYDRHEDKNSSSRFYPTYKCKLLSESPKNVPEKLTSRSKSCIELRVSSHPKAPIARPADCPIQSRRIFFPSTSASQISKTPDQIDGFGDIEEDFNVNLTDVPKDIAALDACILSQVELEKPVVSRLSMLRPPPLNLDSVEMEELEGVTRALDNQIPAIQTSAVEAAGTPYFIRYRRDTSSPLSPLMLSKPHNSQRNKETGERRLGGRFKFLGQYFHKSKPMDEIYRQVDDGMLDYRPYFTYMLCFIHILVTIFACIGYGFAPIGINLEHIVTKQIMMPSLDIENVCRVQDENIWIGPQKADLVRMGARFSPCMRVDETLNRVVVEAQKIWDRKSGCCINMKDGTCYQASRLFCSRSTSTWLHNSDDTGVLLSEPLFDGRTYVNSEKTKRLTTTVRPPPLIGPVCGLDPDFCAEPRSTGPFGWSSTDVTEWPICTRPINSSALAGFAPHMECEVIARPCCVGLKGECIITTPSHCSFLNGHFHSEARLCSQVSCLRQICGMIPFIFPDVPDQMSRIFISLFLHVGILHLAVSLFIQLTVMRHLEKLLGCVRIAAIFVLSGCFSGLASGIMLPYHVHTGPMGAHFALFGVSLMDSLQTIDIFVSPWSVIIKQVVYLVVGFFIGFLPWLDNCAHISGFISGVLLAYVFVPYLGYGSKNQLAITRVSTLSDQVNTGDADHEIYQRELQKLYCRMRRRKVKVIIACLITWCVLFLLLLVAFVKWPLTSCTWCKYLNCLPWTPTLCDTLEVNVHASTRCINPRS